MAQLGRKRKLARLLGVLCAGILVMVVGLPLWFPWVLHPLSSKLGVRYVSYQRLGYGRGRLQNVTLADESTSFHAEQVDVFVPSVWLWHRWLGHRSFAYLRAQNWKLEFKIANASTKSANSSLYHVVKDVDSTWADLRNWVPRADFTNGSVFFAQRVAGEQRRPVPWSLPSGTLRSTVGKEESAKEPIWDFHVPSASWVGGALAAEVVWPRLRQSGTLSAKIADSSFRVELTSDSLRLHSVISGSENSSGLIVGNTNDWEGNRIVASARFGPQGYVPEEATVRAGSFRIPLSLLGLNGAQPVPGGEKVGDVAGSLSFHWQNERFSLDLTGTSQANEPKAGPIDVEVHSRGTINSVFLEKTSIRTPWLTAELTPGTEVQFAPPFLQREARFTTALILDRQPWFPAGGTLTGEARVRPAEAKFPAVAFHFSGQGIAVSNVRTKELAFEGEFKWPLLNLSQASAVLSDGSTASVNGQLEVEKGMLRETKFRWNGPFGQQFLPAGYWFERAFGEISVSGPLRRPSHSGQAAVEKFTNSFLRPLRARATWSGESLAFDRIGVQVDAEKSSLALVGALAITNPITSLSISNLTLSQDGEARMRLQNPSNISIERRGTNAATGIWSIKLTPFWWVGTERALKLAGEIAWPNLGKFAGQAHSLSSSLVSDFVQLPPGQVNINDLSVSTEWQNGPARVDLTGSVDMNWQGLVFSTGTSIKSDEKGITIEKMFVSSKAQPIFSADGLLPLTLTPAKTKQPVNLLPDQPLRFHAAAQTNSAFWSELALATGFVLEEPSLTVDVSGGWQALQGKVQAVVKQIKLPRGLSILSKDLEPRGADQDQLPRPAIDLREVRLSGTLEEQRARIDNLSVLLQGQPVAFTGEVPLGRNFWSGLTERKPKVDWTKASARLEMKDAQIGAFATLLPKVLSREGKMTGKVTLLPGLDLAGELAIGGASTLPLGSLGIVRGIEARLKFQKQVITLEGVTGSLAGAPISATGNMDLSGEGWRPGSLPPFRLHATSLNVPLARSADLVIRSDLNVWISKPRNGPATVTGEAKLRDSFYLADLQDLLPGGVATTRRRPPYFSIETQPWADWRLNLDLKGDRFMKVNSPLFRGQVSTDLKLTGTLKDPMALGIVRIDSGAIQFPFANLEVNQGLINLTSGDPYRPQMLVHASVRTAGFDVKMDATGPADQLFIQFSSTPPLTSEQIVLMLTSGAIPRTDYTLSTQERAERVGLFLGKNLLSQFGLVGESDRLILRTGEDISETGRPTYHAEYKLANRWYLVGEYDQFNAFNVGLRWKIYSR